MFRFSIRDVLWVTVVVGLIMGWSVSYWRWTNERAELELRINISLIDFMNYVQANTTLRERITTLEMTLEVVGVPVPPGPKGVTIEELLNAVEHLEQKP